MVAHPEYQEYIPTVIEETIDMVIGKINMKVKANETITTAIVIMCEINEFAK